MHTLAGILLNSTATYVLRARQVWLKHQPSLTA
jgi:hypothetical protein